VVEAITSEFVELVAVLRDQILFTLATPSATLSLTNLTMAALIAIWWVLRSRLRGPRVLIRALFPRRWPSGTSERADWGLARPGVRLHLLSHDKAELASRPLPFLACGEAAHPAAGLYLCFAILCYQMPWPP